MEIITKKEWLSCTRLNNNCLVHNFFRGYTVNEIPSAEIIAAGINLPNKHGNTPLHYAAQRNVLSDRGMFEKIPLELLTKENLTIKNTAGITPLHIAAQSGEIRLVPKELLNEELLTLPDNNGETPLDYANENSNLDYLLGIEFSDAIIEEVGQEWYDRNNEVLASKKELIQEEVEVPTIDLF